MSGELTANVAGKKLIVCYLSAYADFAPAGASNLLGSTDCIRGIVAVMEVPLPGLEVILKRPP